MEIFVEDQVSDTNRISLQSDNIDINWRAGQGRFIGTLKENEWIRSTEVNSMSRREEGTKNGNLGNKNYWRYKMTTESVVEYWPLWTKRKEVRNLQDSKKHEKKNLSRNFRTTDVQAMGCAEEEVTFGTDVIHGSSRALTSRPSKKMVLNGLFRGPAAILGISCEP